MIKKYLTVYTYSYHQARRKQFQIGGLQFQIGGGGVGANFFIGRFVRGVSKINITCPIKPLTFFSGLRPTQQMIKFTLTCNIRLRKRLI